MTGILQMKRMESEEIKYGKKNDNRGQLEDEQDSE